MQKITSLKVIVSKDAPNIEAGKGWTWVRPVIFSAGENKISLYLYYKWEGGTSLDDATSVNKNTTYVAPLLGLFGVTPENSEETGKGYYDLPGWTVFAIGDLPVDDL